jgi:hypothetical protein
MRSIAFLLAVALALAPGLVAARDREESPRRARDRRRTVASDPARPAPAVYEASAPAAKYGYSRPAPAAAPARPAAPRVVVRPGVAVVGALPFWWGLSWGWGYRPLYPRPAPPPSPDDGYDPAPDGEYVAAADPERATTRLSAVGAGMAGARDGGLGGLSLAIDGRDLGVNVSVDAIAIDGVTGPAGSSEHDAIGWGSAHLTWSFAAQEAFRLRLELGASMLSLPSSGAFGGTTAAGKVAFGPDVGISGQLGLVGPLGVEAHARITPYPIPVLDTRVAAVLRGGPLALTAGWRTVRIEGDGVDAPVARFEGPEVGLALVF